MHYQTRNNDHNVLNLSSLLILYCSASIALEQAHAYDKAYAIDVGGATSTAYTVHLVNSPGASKATPTIHALHWLQAALSRLSIDGARDGMTT